jgi:hypothetical protein
MNTIRRSYALFRESRNVLAKDKELLVFPILSGLYATEGRTPPGFSPEYVQNAFAAKGSGRLAFKTT